MRAASGLRVVHLASAGGVGGAETMVLNIVASARAEAPAWQLHVVAPETGALLRSAGALGADAMCLPFPAGLGRWGESGTAPASLAAGAVPAALGGARYAWRLARLLRRLRPDVVHAHGLKMQILAACAAPREALLVWHAHDYLVGRRLSAMLLRLAARRADAVAAVSAAVASDLEDRCGARPPLVRVVYNAVDLAAFSPDGPALDLDRLAGAAPADGAVRVGLVAAFGRWKGHEVFLEAVARLPRALPLRAYIVGGAVYRTAAGQRSEAEVRALVDRFGLGERVVFTGVVEDVPSALRALDIVVHASTRPEPFGMTIAEAMACGRAVVAARGSGAGERATDGVDLVEHPPGDAAALAAILEALVRDPARRAALGRSARRAAELHFDRRRLAAELRGLYAAAEALRAGPFRPRVAPA
jgi:glycosyltransferase involved in cell wall biosynthesis